MKHKKRRKKNLVNNNNKNNKGKKKKAIIKTFPSGYVAADVDDFLYEHNLETTITLFYSIDIYRCLYLQEILLSVRVSRHIVIQLIKTSLDP